MDRSTVRSDIVMLDIGGAAGRQRVCLQGMQEGAEMGQLLLLSVTWRKQFSEDLDSKDTMTDEQAWVC